MCNYARGSVIQRMMTQPVLRGFFSGGSGGGVALRASGSRTGVTDFVMWSKTTYGVSMRQV
jgi:hypothetical protein